MSDVKKPSYEAVLTAEYRLLNAIAKKPEYLEDSKVSSNLFVDEVAKSIYEGLESLYKRHIPITEASLIQACQEIDYNVTNNEVKGIFAIDNKGADTLDDIIPVLVTEINKKNISEKIDSIKKTLNKEGKIDVKSIESTLYEVENQLNKVDTSDKNILSTDEMFDEYIDDLDRRFKDKKRGFGDVFLDKYIVKGALPGRITAIVASTNMGKSTYALNMASGLIRDKSPCLYVSLEMGMIDTIDRFIVNWSQDLTNSNLYDPQYIDAVKDIVENQRSQLEGNKFYFCKATGVDTIKLRQLIREFKQKSNSNYGMVIIDLVSCLTDYMNGARGGSTASSIELCMNKIEDIAKAENVHIVVIAQLNRQSDSGNIFSESDIEKLRPSLGDIKNSGAIAEKSTTVLALFRGKYYFDRYLNGSSTTKYDKDVLDVTILKDRDAPAGTRFEYIFDGSRYLLTPIYDSDTDYYDKDFY